jgi:hypothetical protein
MLAWFLSLLCRLVVPKFPTVSSGKEPFRVDQQLGFEELLRVVIGVALVNKGLSSSRSSG